MSEPSRPAFDAPLYAALRQGAKEVGQALQAFPDSVRTVEEPGTLGNPTPQMVTAQAQPGDYRQLLADSARQAEARDQPGPGLDR